MRSLDGTQVSRLPSSLLSKLEDDLLDRSVPLGDLLRDCLVCRGTLARPGCGCGLRRN